MDDFMNSKNAILQKNAYKFHELQVKNTIRLKFYSLY